MDAQAIEAVLLRRFRLDSVPTLCAPTLSQAPIAFSHLQCGNAGHGRTGTVPVESSFAFQVLLRPVRSWEIWTDKRHQRLPPSGPGDVCLFDLNENPQLEVHDPFDMVRFYISQSALDSLAYERGHRRPAGLRLPDFWAKDAVMHGMATSVAASMQRPNEVQAMFVEHIALAFHAHAVHAYGGISQSDHRHGGLTPARMRRASDIMQSELEVNHSISRLANECGLSSRHFARAFKETTGLAPHRWIMRRRVKRSRELMAQTEMELAEIALACGFVDQSHFSRVFTQIEKQSPARWRRQLNK